jgi:TPR repeat protein
MLGYCYEKGIGINIDKQKAAELYQKAANLGHKVAQYNLALMYKNGDGIEKDLDKAIYWYEQSSKQGFQKAQNKLKELKKIRNNICK